MANTTPSTPPAAAAPPATAAPIAPATTSAPVPAPAPVTTGQSVTPAAGGPVTVTAPAVDARTGQVATVTTPATPGATVGTVPTSGPDGKAAVALDPGLQFAIKTFDNVDPQAVATLDLNDIRERFIHRTSDAAVIDYIPLLVAALRGRQPAQPEAAATPAPAPQK